jgi:hypothetical protein
MYVLSFQTVFEVVKEGRILYNPKGHTRLNPVASGTFSGDCQER